MSGFHPRWGSSRTHFATVVNESRPYRRNPTYVERRTEAVACGAKNWGYQETETASDVECKSCRRTRAWKAAFADEVVTARAAIETFVREIYPKSGHARPELTCEIAKALEDIIEYWEKWDEVDENGNLVRIR